MKNSIRHDYPLRSHNTFGMDVRARRYLAVTSTDQLQMALAGMAPPFWVLGGGSNVLFTGDIEPLVLHNAIRERTILKEEGDYALVAGGGGENWHEFVDWCIGQELGGIENLSLIPGTLGAAPIQNIGAYGVELYDVFDHLEAVELATGKICIFQREDCRFGYRDSIFKGVAKGKYCITRVVLRLTRRRHRIDTHYEALRRHLIERDVHYPTIRDVSEAVIHIRRSKLPDPRELGNAGSFFKNPEITAAAFVDLQKRFPAVVHYPLGNGRVKVPAGWLIEQCGWKGKRMGDAGCYEKQALVLVNYGQARPKDLLALARAIVRSVRETFGIELTPEVNVV